MTCGDAVLCLNDGETGFRRLREDHFTHAIGQQDWAHVLRALRALARGTGGIEKNQALPLGCVMRKRGMAWMAEPRTASASSALTSLIWQCETLSRNLLRNFTGS